MPKDILSSISRDNDNQDYLLFQIMSNTKGKTYETSRFAVSMIYNYKCHSDDVCLTCDIMDDWESII